jgi:AraC-like DNA-binding protein
MKPTTTLINGGLRSVDDVGLHLKVSRRYLEKQFLIKVGVSPKFYSCIKRISALSNKIAHAKKADWQEIILESRLHDQSHLVKKIPEFNRMSPSDYHQHHHEMMRFV